MGREGEGGGEEREERSGRGRGREGLYVTAQLRRTIRECEVGLGKARGRQAGAVCSRLTSWDGGVGGVMCWAGMALMTVPTVCLPCACRVPTVCRPCRCRTLRRRLEVLGNKVGGVTGRAVVCDLLYLVLCNQRRPHPHST